MLGVATTIPKLPIAHAFHPGNTHPATPTTRILLPQARAPLRGHLPNAHGSQPGPPPVPHAAVPPPSSLTNAMHEQFKDSIHMQATARAPTCASCGSPPPGLCCACAATPPASWTPQTAREGGGNDRAWSREEREGEQGVGGALLAWSEGGWGRTSLSVGKSRNSKSICRKMAGRVQAPSSTSMHTCCCSSCGALPPCVCCFFFSCFLSMKRAMRPMCWSCRSCTLPSRTCGVSEGGK